LVKLKVLQIIDSLGMGGAETWLLELLRFWKDNFPQHARMDFLLTSGRTGIFDEEATRLGAQLFYVPYRKNSLLTFAQEFRRILRAGQYDAVHDHADFVSGWHFLMGTGHLPAVRVTHVHNPAYQLVSNYGVNAGRRLSSRLGKHLVTKYATTVLGTSRQLLEEYGFSESPRFRPRGAALHCGFQLRRFAGDPTQCSGSLCREFGWEPETPVILFAGRLDESLEFSHPRNHKNSAFAVAVFEECLKRNPRLKMIMAGANEHMRSTFEAHLSKLGLSESVRLLGIRQDIERLMLGSRVLLFPSRAEGLGMVAVEAQAAGLPVVASTAVPQECVVIPEIIHFEDLQTPVAAWAKTISRAMDQPRPEPTTEDARWITSGFNIRVSSNLLEKVYLTGSVEKKAFA
jgi:glycosyltransferase involved in cell wall biosynthesis